MICWRSGSAMAASGAASAGDEPRQRGVALPLVWLPLPAAHPPGVSAPPADCAAAGSGVTGGVIMVISREREAEILRYYHVAQDGASSTIARQIGVHHWTCPSAAASPRRNGAVRLCRRLHDPGAQRAWRRAQRLPGGPGLGRLERRTAPRNRQPPLALDRAQRFLYAIHADLDEVSAYAIDKQTGRIRRSTGNPVAARTRCTCRSIRPWLDHHRQLRRRLGRRRTDREGRNPGAACRSGHPAR